jgi:hypothetical protein
MHAKEHVPSPGFVPDVHPQSESVVQPRVHTPAEQIAISLPTVSEEQSAWVKHDAPMLAEEHAAMSDAILTTPAMQIRQPIPMGPNVHEEHFGITAATSGSK